MTTVNIPIELRKALRSSKHFRNGTYPSPHAQTFMQEETNHLLWVRSKCPASFSCPPAEIPDGDETSGDVARWRSAFHAGTHAGQLWCRFEVMNSGLTAAGGAIPDPYARLLVELGDGTDVGTIEFHTGGSGDDGDTIFAPNRWATGTFPLKSSGSIVTLTPQTDYYLKFSDVGARTVSVCVFEKSLAADTDNGYLPDGPVAGGPVFDEDRGDMIAALRTAWKRNQTQLWNWSSSTDATAPSRTSGTRANWIDQTITTESSSSPGVKLYMANKSTVRRASSGVPVKWQIFAQRSAAGGGNPIVYLMDGSDNVIDSIGITSTTAQWYAGTSPLYLAANDTTKYSLAFQGNGVQGVTLYASSLFSYET